MGLELFIPEVWTARILERLRHAQVFTQPGVINRDYEGEIRNQGDTVRITGIGTVTVSDYTKNTDISAPEALTDAQSMLTISQQKYFNFQVDDVDAAQGNPAVMDAAMREAAYSLKDKADQYVAALYSEADTANWIGTVASTTAAMGTTYTKAYEYLVDLATKLDEADNPSDGRWAIVPPWFHAYLLKDDRFVKSGTPSGDTTLRNGIVGEAAGFTILKSNNYPYSGLDKTKKNMIVAGLPAAWSFAQQVNKVEAYRPQLRFADAVKGLYLYGAKVVRPQSLAVLCIDRA